LFYDEDSFWLSSFIQAFLYHHDVLVTLNVISNSDVNNIYQTPLTSTDYFLNQLMTVFIFSRSMDTHMEGV